MNIEKVTLHVPLPKMLLIGLGFLKQDFNSHFLESSLSYKNRMTDPRGAIEESLGTHFSHASVEPLWHDSLASEIT